MKKLWQRLTLIGLLSIFIAACSGGDGGTVFPPATPTAFTASAGNAQVGLSWAQAAGATSYNVYYGTTPGVTTASPTKVTGIAGTSQNVTGLTNGTTYYFVVTAVNGFGESAKSVEKSASPLTNPPPFAPSGVTAVAGVASATVNWIAQPGATSYTIYYGTAAGVTTASPTKVTGITGTSQTVAGLTNGTKYFFVVTAVNANGESPVSPEVSATPAAIPPPPAPTSLTATAGNGQATLSWTAAAGATSYNVYKATSTPVIPGAGTLAVPGITGTSTTIGGLTNGTTYYFVVTAVSANGESGKSNEVSVTPTAPTSRGPFSQSDLAGTWNFMIFITGPEVSGGTFPGWMHGKATIDASGNVTVTSITSSDNSVTTPPPGTLTETIDVNGVVTEGGINGAGAGNHAVMAANKQLIVGTGTMGNNQANQAIRIFVKLVPGVTFSNADLANTSFVFHELHSGFENIWAYGAGSVDGSLQSTISSVVIPTGTATPPPASTVAISADGIITSINNPTFHGVVTPDKKTSFGVETNGNKFALRIYQITGQTYALSDLASTWYSHTVVSSSTLPEWAHSTITFTSTGVGTETNAVESTGPQPNSTFSATLSATGIIGSPVESDVHGFMSFNKDLFVVTSTWTTGQAYALNVGVK